MTAANDNRRKKRERGEAAAAVARMIHHIYGSADYSQQPKPRRTRAPTLRGATESLRGGHR
jgi:hypothetical protein